MEPIKIFLQSHFPVHVFFWIQGSIEHHYLWLGDPLCGVPLWVFLPTLGATGCRRFGRESSRADRWFEGLFRLEFQDLIHEKFELGFCLVLIPSKLFYIPDQGLGPFRHLFRASGGVGDRPEVRSRSGGHALIPDDACARGFSVPEIQEGSRSEAGGRKRGRLRHY